ncbi:hypothetical protein ACH79_28715 [Bradyrhizobium sp. CCBAU 051011]|nr:hypothetical protein ACH79_28715 [Bradyrhizobium sp. CCBAU 051011]
MYLRSIKLPDCADDDGFWMTLIEMSPARKILDRIEVLLPANGIDGLKCEQQVRFAALVAANESCKLLDWNVSA